MISGPASLNELSRFLETLTDSASAALTRLSENEWREPWAPGKWTRIEVLGHLLDSAAHNHQRFALALHKDSIVAPGYDGDAQVRVQRYAQAPVAVVVEAWHTHNRVLSFVIGQIPVEKEGTPCVIGAFQPVTLRELAFDYVAHLEHHLRQMFAGREMPQFSGMPWPPDGRWQEAV